MGLVHFATPCIAVNRITARSPLKDLNSLLLPLACPGYVPKEQSDGLRVTSLGGNM